MTVDEIKKEAIKSARKLKKEDVEEAINFFKEEPTADEMFKKLKFKKQKKD